MLSGGLGATDDLTMANLYRQLGSRERNAPRPEKRRMDQYLPLIILAFLAAFVVTPLSGKLAHHTGFVDEPQPHKMHVRPIPLLGGLAIYLSLCVVLYRLFQINLSSDCREWRRWRPAERC